MCRPAGQFLRPATRDGRAQRRRTGRPLSSMLAQSRLPLLTTSDFRVRLLAAKTQARLGSLEHETSSFAGGPAGAAVPPSQSDVSVSVRLSGPSARLTSSSFSLSRLRCGTFPTLRLKLESLLGYYCQAEYSLNFGNSAGLVTGGPGGPESGRRRSS